MTEKEAFELLPQYTDGLLDDERSRAVAALVDGSPKLQMEVARLKRESAEVGELLSEALSPLKPSRSARMRISDAMLEVHRRAENVANNMPARGWTFFRWVFTAVSVVIAGVAASVQRPAALDESVLLFYIGWVLYVVGVLLVLFGHSLADLEARFLGMVTREEPTPTRLEILMLEVFGVCCVIAAAAVFLMQN